MWLLSPEQAARLSAMQRRRDLARLSDVLAAVFPEAKARLADRWDTFVELGSVRAQGYGMVHMLCVARLHACMVACGSDFEARQAWAGSILNDPKRGQGAKAHQVAIGVLEQLRSAPLAGQPSAQDFQISLKQLDQQLAAAGTLGSLFPRERIRLGVDCDLDAVELQLVDPHWRQHYTAQGGPWRREACPPKGTTLMLVHDALAESAITLPEQISLLSRPVQSDVAARLRVRVKTAHRCDALLHPMVQWRGPQGARTLRGDAAEDCNFVIHSPSASSDATLPPHIGEENSPQYSLLDLSSCGLRARGLPIGELSTRLAAYDATQHLMAWRRDVAAPWQLPNDEQPPKPVVRCRREVDGRGVESPEWMAGLEGLDAQLHRGLSRLFTAWERETGVEDGRLSVEAGLLEGSAGVTWGWSESPMGLAEVPYMRLEGLSDLTACRLALRFTGILSRGGSRSMLTLSTQGSFALRGAWQRGPADAALFAVAAKQQVPVHQTFNLTVTPLADAALGMLNVAGPLRGSIQGAVGLEQRPDGPGLQWFVRLKLEPVVAQLRIVDPLLGVQNIVLPMLPAQPLVDWSLA